MLKEPIEMDGITLIATSKFGLETLVKQEVQALGFTDLQVADGRIQFPAAINDIPRLNLWLRFADRLLLVMGTPYAPSPALLAANERLMAKRAAAGISAPAQPAPTKGSGPAVGLPVALPPHLGWGSPAETQLLRQDQLTVNNQQSTVNNQQSTVNSQQSAIRNPQSEQTIHIYPTLAQAMLRQGEAAAGRLWWLLREQVKDCGGHLSQAEAISLATHHWQLFKTPRRVRQLLAAGDGLFWTVNGRGIWLHGVARVAAALGVTRLQGKRVQMPASQLSGSLKQAKAALRATFFAAKPKTISRHTESSLTGLCRRTLQNYDALPTGVKQQENIAIGSRCSQEAAQETAWKRGCASFTFVDSQGKLGPAGASYLAWQMANSYHSAYPTVAKGRQRRINQQLSDLVKHRGQGTAAERFVPLYHQNGVCAVKAFERQPAHDAYYPKPASIIRRTGLWFVLEGGK